MENKSSLGVPIAVVIAGLLIAGAIYLSAGKTPAQPNTAANPPETVYPLEKMAAVSSSDHVRGNKNAKIVFVDYSDLECPFCKMFHWSMEEVMKKYGDQVAWVYRHYPLDCNDGTTPNCNVLHTQARKEAEAAECVAELGGEEKFWQYTDKIFAVTSSNDGLDLAQLPIYAAELGVDKTAFNTCLESGRHAQKIVEDTTDGTNIGLDGTPFVVAIDKDSDTTIVALRGPAPENTSDLFKEISAYLDGQQQINFKHLQAGTKPGN